MKVLLVNNYHHIRGGAERAYFDMGKILKERGEEIAYFSVKQEGNLPSEWSSYFPVGYDLSGNHGFFNSLKIAFSFLYNFSAKKNIQKIIKDFKPDIVHFHNIYHHLSPAIVDGVKKCGVPMVMTLHDYKLICPERTMYAHGKIWERSKKHKYYRCFLDKCVKNSYSKSLLASLEAYLHHFLGTYKKIDLFISPSKFLKNKFKEFGFKNGIINIPNPLADVNFEAESKEKEYGKYILYFGRLAYEKGVADLIKAFKEVDTNYRFLIVGDGDEKEALKKTIKDCNLDKRVIMLSRKEGNELWGIVKGAQAIFFPSSWYENYPYSVLEPMSLGKVLIASSLGGIPEMLEDGNSGLLFEPGNKDELKKKMELVVDETNKDKRKKIGENAKRSVFEKNSQDLFYEKIMENYKKLLTENS